MSLPPRPADPARWPAFRSLGAGGLLPAAALAFAPKCALCVLGYAGLGAALGLTGPELCGAPAGPALTWSWSLAAALAAAGWLVQRWCRR